MIIQSLCQEPDPVVRKDSDIWQEMLLRAPTVNSFPAIHFGNKKYKLDVADRKKETDDYLREKEANQGQVVCIKELPYVPSTVMEEQMGDRTERTARKSRMAWPQGGTGLENSGNNQIRGFDYI